LGRLNGRRGISEEWTCMDVQGQEKLIGEMGLLNNALRRSSDVEA
jgi:hypothetical protein